jgi:hypothetical protein
MQRRTELWEPQLKASIRCPRNLNQELQTADPRGNVFLHESYQHFRESYQQFRQGIRFIGPHDVDRSAFSGRRCVSGESPVPDAAAGREFRADHTIAAVPDHREVCTHSTTLPNQSSSTEAVLANHALRRPLIHELPGSFGWSILSAAVKGIVPMRIAARDPFSSTTGTPGYSPGHRRNGIDCPFLVPGQLDPHTLARLCGSFC